MRDLAILVVLLTMPAAVLAGPAAYRLDSDRTLPQFAIDRFGFSKLQGFFAKSSGRLVVDRAAQTGTLELAVQTGSLYLGEPTALNRQAAIADSSPARAPAFLKVDTHPTMMLKAERLRFDGNLPAAADAEITFVGVTRPVTLQLSGWQCDRRGSGTEVCAGIATATVRRSAFGVTLGYPIVGDDVALRIVLHAVKD